ncbi:G8 domain-containing protein, partial [Candidatus Methanophagaceae archaeon]
MKTIKKVLVVSFVILITSLNVFSATITSIGTGDWSNAATWDAGVPVAGDDVIIAAGHTVTLNQDATVLSLTVNNTGVLVIGNDATARSLTVTGATAIAGSLTVGTFDITHTISFQGAVTNNGTLDLYNTSGQIANVVLDGNFTIGGTVSPQFNGITFNTGTVTAGIAFDINGAVIIETGASFADGNFTHTVAGNWTENGTGQMTGNGTIQMDASLIQSVTAAATFYNLTYNGAGMGVLGANITVTNNFYITNNTEVQSSQQHIFQSNFTVDDGSKYEATAGRATFNSSTQQQTVTTGTTDGEPNVEFYQAYFDNGGAANQKLIDGDMIVNNTIYIYNDAEVNDNGDTHTQTLTGGYFNGTCGFSGTIVMLGGTYYDNNDDDFTLGTADITVKGYSYIGAGDIMRVNGDMTVILNDEGNHIGFIINNNAELRGSGSNTLTVSDNTSLYIRGINNFPTTFVTVTLENESYVRYDAALNDQTVYAGVIYGRLYLNQGTTKTAAGNLDVNSHLYVYNSTDFRLQSFDHTFAGYIYNSDDAHGNGSITATGGTVTLDAADANQYIYDAGTGTYTFNNLVLTNTAPTVVRYKRFYNGIIVNGNFTVTNTGGDNANRLYVDIYEHVITGGNNFNLGSYVWLFTSGTNTFQTTVSSFSGTITLDVNSTVRFNRTTNGSDQNIPGGVTYGNIEFYGSNQKIPQANLDINGNVSAVGYTPVLTDLSHQINVAGDWNMSLVTTNLTGTNVVIFDGTNQDISQSNFSHVYFSNSGTKNISGTLDILNNLVIQTNVIVDAGERNIYIEGNWTENGSGQFHQIGGRVTFDGTTANQTIQTNANSYFYNFTIDKSGANKLLTLNSDIDINGTFDFAEDNASLNMNGNDFHVARDFYFREGCTF